MPLCETYVKIHNGVPTIFAGGKPLHGMTATSCAFDDPRVIRDFVAGGVEIMMIWIEAAIHCWKAPGVYDWTYAEEKLAFFEKHSADTKWIIRVRLGLVNKWFAEMYPDEIHPRPTAPNQKHVMVNIVSSIWRNHICEVVRDFTEWLQTTRWADRIIGFMLNAGATEEWLIFDTDKTYHGNYHASSIREFRRWLKERYSTDEKLAPAWKSTGVTLDNAMPPSGFDRQLNNVFGAYSLLEPSENQRFMDYYYFLNETLADGMIDVCKAAKSASKNPIICGGFHSYLWWETGVYSYIQEYGHTLIQRLKNSKWVDFISDITSYDCRYPGGPSGYLGIPASINLDGKLHYTEVDLVTVESLPEKYRAAWKKADISNIPPRTAEPVIPNKTWQWDVNYCGRDMDEQIAILRREHMHNLITGTPYWWFDIRSHSYRAPEIISAMRQLSDIGKNAVNHDRGSICEVALVLSEDTPLRQSAANGTLMRFELESLHGQLIDSANREWGLAGVPFDVYEINDLAKPHFPGEQYKLMLFLNCAYIPGRAAGGVRRWQNNNRVMVWTYAPAVMGDKKINPSIGEDLRGIRLGWRNDRQHIHVSVKNASHPLAKQGKKLDFWCEGSVGPVFFADDPESETLGTLTHGGESAFAVRTHENWASVYLSLFTFSPQLMRNLAEFAGAHIWCDSDDVIYANRSLLCLHTASKGRKKIILPAPAYATDLWTGKRTLEPVTVLYADMPAYRTGAWRLEYT